MRNLINAFICLLLAVPCQGRIITVDDDGPADFDNIQTAIDAATNGDGLAVADAQPLTVILNQQIDTDGDGLSDFQEIHKYLTDPTNPDTDADGIPDSDWNERREYTYSVSSILRFMYPFDEDALNSNFQDARVVEEEDYYIEMEIIHYPFSTAEDSISANPNWQEDYADMNEYLEPGITTNWDPNMKADLLAELQADGIVIGNLTDKQVIQQVSSWVLNNYNAFYDIFTTHYVYFPNNLPEIYPGLEDAFAQGSGPHGWTVQEQFEHELLGREMYYNKTCGTCTSFAIALTTVLRAVGIPTRMILVIPAVDPSNPIQFQLVQQGISNSNVRQVMLNWLAGAGTGYTAHTFNEVYVGNQWHRLNYSKLGQPILDKHCFGLHTHLYTFNDLSDANLASTWGWRFGKVIRDDIFQYGNPYTTIILSDLLGEHAIRPPGATIYVDDDSPIDPGPGDPTISDPCEDGSILHPYDSIQEAIDVAEDGNTIIVQQGTYTGPGNRDIDFKGLAIIVRSTEPNNPDVVAATIIDCQGSESEPHRGFHFHSYESGDSILDGLTITNGYASGNWPQDSGGAILCYPAGPTIKNCIITNNIANVRGGGIYNYFSSPILTNCMFIGNSSEGYGGAMYNHTVSLNATNCTFSENSAADYGGGICNAGSYNSLSLTGCIFNGNLAGFCGGGMYHEYSSNLTLTNCTLSGNWAADYHGGGMYNYSCHPKLSNCILWDNAPEEIYVHYSTPVITYCDVQGGWTGTGNINDDPCFVDPCSGDYHLKMDSPCINAGDPNYVAGPNETDLDGNPRVIGGRIDMGAYEFNHIPIADPCPNQTAYAWIDELAEVTLDDSASYDDDGHPLSYLWSWTVDSNTYEANAVNPTIELPVGQHIIELIVNDGIDDSEPNEVVVTVIGPMYSHLWISP